jgi:cytochrome c oxidase cbb3-type subunit III
MKSETTDNGKVSPNNAESPKKPRPENCKCKGDCPCCDEKDKKKKDEQNSTKNEKVVVASSIALMLCVPAFAQTSATPSFWTDPFNHPMLPLYATMALLFITIGLVLFTMIYLVRVIKFLLQQNEMEKAAKAGVAYTPAPSLFEKIWQDLNASVPVAKENDIDLGHSYDGIRELDNHLPPWWKGLFYGCIIWGIGYLIVYHVTDSFPLSINEYENELASANEQARILKASKPAEVIDENSLNYTADAELIAKGKIVFITNNCGSCHRADGGGNTIGPNLTDAYWIHGGSVRNVFTTINTGVVEKGMPAWGKVMSAADVRNVSFYIMSLRGSNPADAKAPQGELYQPVEESVAVDSTTAIAN